MLTKHKLLLAERFHSSYRLGVTVCYSCNKVNRVLVFNSAHNVRPHFIYLCIDCVIKLLSKYNKPYISKALQSMPFVQSTCYICRKLNYRDETDYFVDNPLGCSWRFSRVHKYCLIDFLTDTEIKAHIELFYD